MSAQIRKTAEQPSVKAIETDLGRKLQGNLDTIDLLVNRGYLADLTLAAPVPTIEDEESYKGMALMRISKVAYLKGEDINEKLVNVYGALSTIGSSVLLLAKGDPRGVEFYLGIREPNYERRLVSEGVLESSLRGNFPGIEASPCSEDEVRSLMEASFPHAYDYRSLTSVTIVPSERAEETRHDSEQSRFVQGIEKFIEGMEGQPFTALFLAAPVGRRSLKTVRETYEELSTSLSVMRQMQRQISEQEGGSVADGINNSFSNSLSKGFSETAGSHSDSSRARSKNRDRHRNSQVFMLGSSGGTSRGTTSTTSSGTNQSRTSSSTKTSQTGGGTSRTTTASTSSTRAVTLTQTNKQVDALLQRIDAQLKRIDSCEAYGVWEVGCFFVSKYQQVSIMAASLFKALMSGERSQLETPHINTWPNDRAAFPRVAQVFDTLRLGLVPKFAYEVPLDRKTSHQTISPVSLISGKELPLVLGLPRHSVSGVTAVSSAEFGRNVLRASKRHPAREIDLGVVSYMGKAKTQIPVRLDADSLTAHCLITGSTGSGKSNATYQIINELVDARNDVSVLVIEPAKGEYKIQYGRLPGVGIFTTNPRYGDMLHMNPFAFPPEVHVLEHLDRIIEVFSACWPLYAAMPALLKKSFEQAYMQHGWDLSNSYHIELGNGRWPTFTDICELLPSILDSSEFSGDTKGDYIGSLVTRVNSLTTGLVGQIFSGEPVPAEILFDQNAIVDLSRIGSTETKALIMGTLVLQLNEHRQSSKVNMNAGLRHVTILEEAHNLLRKTSPEQSQEGANLQGKSVEMISNSIAEMRTYGEGFIIVDQSPSAVDVSAIRNTNTKIILRLPEQDDRRAAGASIGLSDDQIAEMAKLPQGHAVVYQNDWLEPVLTKINRAEESYRRLVPKANDPADRAALAGLFIEELLKQESRGAVVKSRFDAIARTGPGSASDKNEMRRAIAALSAASGATIDKKMLSRTIAVIAGTGDLLEVLASQLPSLGEGAVASISNKREFATWKKLAKAHLRFYASLKTDRAKESVLDHLIEATCEERRTASWKAYAKVRNSIMRG